MPTKKQLYRNWKSQIGLFGGVGLPKQSFESHTDGHGLVSEQYIDKPLISRNRHNKPRGKVIGKIKYNHDSKQITIIPNTSDADKNL